MKLSLLSLMVLVMVVLLLMMMMTMNMMRVFSMKLMNIMIVVRKILEKRSYLVAFGRSGGVVAAANDDDVTCVIQQCSSYRQCPYIQASRCVIITLERHKLRIELTQGFVFGFGLENE